MLRIYSAHAMTGRSNRRVLKETEAVEAAIKIFSPVYGVKVLLADPAKIEGIKPVPGKINASEALIDDYWPRDKKYIRWCHVLLDLTGWLYSQGVIHEIGLQRYCLWKPVIRVFPGLPKNSIAWREDDVIVPDIETAVRVALENWGTWGKRFVWRVKMLNRCLPKWIGDQIKAFF